jgi:3-hydroxy-9,10-secoandrosta-1,3,5(10)-triene-9,17-dione monooxygenase
LAPSAIGAAEGAYEMFLASMAKRAGTYTGAKVADFQAVQIKLARARCLIDSARHLLRQSAIELQAAAERNQVPELATKLRYRAQSAFAVARLGAVGVVVVLRRARHLRVIRCSGICAT